ncbi:MAG: YihA family ribosome biogenesis GTP-binding protein [Bacteroidales bacterium]|nr:YihA family ribosome biogenesis GTP-binding protein [Bacteroidales bacterium]
MIIKQAVFAGSSEHLKDRPAARLPEFAFIGRSNVGKSSLINCLCNNGKLAHTSATPGKTQLVNHFLINDSWYLVDLPGYGYAKMGKAGREKLSAMIREYVLGSPEMVLLFVLLDSRHDLQKIDLEFLTTLGEEGVPFAIIYTKCDKSGAVALETQLAKNNAGLLEYWEELPPVFRSSSKDGTGREEILAYIETVLKSL